MAHVLLILLLLPLALPLSSSFVQAQNSGRADLANLGEGSSAISSFRIPDTSLLPLLSSVFQNLEKDLILKSTRGAKEQKIFRDCAPGVVYVQTKDTIGSGFIIDRGGHILTNHHVVASNQTVVVVFKPRHGEDLTKGVALKANVEKVDEVADLALLKVENPPPSISILSFGETNTLKVGMDVHSIGHPMNETWTYTRGTISAIRSNYEITIDEKPFRANVIQHQTPINPGNSGGPLLIDSCKVIGMNTFVKGREGLNFAVSADTIRRFLEAPIPNQKPTPQSIGLTCPKHEFYNLIQWGWGIITGCYAVVSSPPPDFWISQSEAGAEPSSIAADLDHNGSLETAIIKNLEQGGVNWAFDNDCDGFIDTIGYQPAGSTAIETYGQPQKKFILADFVKEIDYALRAKVIPHTMLSVCR